MSPVSRSFTTTTPTTIETTTTEYQPATRGSQFTPPCDPPCVADDPCWGGYTQWHVLPCEITTVSTVSEPRQLPATGGGTVVPATGLLLLGLLMCTVTRRRVRA